MIDILTVVFREELVSLEIQAQSLDIYVNPSDVNVVFVVINDDEINHTDINPNWWGNLRTKVKIIHRSQLYHTWTRGGWDTQQILKLVTTGMSQSEWTMVLDAKTFIVDPLDLNSIIVDDKIHSGIFEIKEVFKSAGDQVSKLFNKPVQRVAGPGGVPFFFKSNLVREMIQYIEEQQREDFVAWFENNSLITEFILYSGFLEANHGGLEKFYHLESQIRVENLCHSEVDIVHEKISNMENNKNLTISIHRNAWNKIEQEYKTRYVRLLESKKITKAKYL